jgi:hypothetical protein
MGRVWLVMILYLLVLFILITLRCNSVNNIHWSLIDMWGMRRESVLGIEMVLIRNM